MAFHEIPFPADIAYGATGEPEPAKIIVATALGYEQHAAVRIADGVS